MFSLRAFLKAFTVLPVCFVILMCGGTEPEDNNKDVADETGVTPIRVVDGKVRFRISEDMGLRKAIGVPDMDLTGAKVVVNGQSYGVKTDPEGTYYIEVKESKGGVYSAALCPTGADKWYKGTPFTGLTIPFSQFYGLTAESLRSYPMFAQYDKAKGDRLEFKDIFSVIDLNLLGEDKSIASIKVETAADELIAGAGPNFPKEGFKVEKGVDYAVLNCTNHGKGVNLDGNRHFYLVVAPGRYGLGFTITDLSHRAMSHTVKPLSLAANTRKDLEFDYAPDEDLVFYEGFDNFVWGGDIMSGKGASGYAPDGNKVTWNSSADRDGYAGCTVEVPYNMPGTPFIQSNTWSEVSGKTVQESHKMPLSYVQSRNIADWQYMFRTQEFPGYVGVGLGGDGGTGGRGIMETGRIEAIKGMRNIRASFDLCFQTGATDDLLFSISSAHITEVYVDDEPCSQSSGFVNTAGQVILSRSFVTVPSDAAARKPWHKVVVEATGATDGASLHFGGNSTDGGVHGFFIDNIEVRTVGEEASRKPGTVRVLYWNIQNGMWADQANGYDNFVEWVKKYDPDICVWCEAGTIYKDNTATKQDKKNRYLPDGWQKLAARYGHKYAAVGGVRDNYPQAITSKYPIETLARITDTENSGKPVAHGAGVHKVVVNGHELDFLTLHLWPQLYGYGVNGKDERAESQKKNEGDYYRLYEITWLMQHVINNPEYPSGHWLMMGDFNSRSQYDNWYYGYPENDTKLLVHKYIAGNTNLVDIIARKYPGEFVSTTMGNARIDYMYASPSVYDAIDAAYVVVDKWTNARPSTYHSSFYDPSDHRPILVDLKF